jgi:16S rRNA (guanine966-N2)-methyltransferase
MDRNREALFSSLGDVVVGAAVLDLFAGTGSLGLEALSRGASSAVFVEWNPPAVAVLRENVGKVGLGGSVAATGSRETFDLVFVDPPYELPLASVQEVLELLVDLLNPSAIVMLHRRAGDAEPTVPDALELTWHRQYGDAHIWRFTRKSEETER